MKKRKPPVMMIFKKHRPTGSTAQHLPPGIPDNAKTYRRVNGILIETDRAGRNTIIPEGRTFQEAKDIATGVKSNTKV